MEESKKNYRDQESKDDHNSETQKNKDKNKMDEVENSRNTDLLREETLNVKEANNKASTSTNTNLPINDVDIEKFQKSKVINRDDPTLVTKILEIDYDSDTDLRKAKVKKVMKAHPKKSYFAAIFGSLLLLGSALSVYLLIKHKKKYR